MVEHFENLGLSERRLLVFLAHLLYVNLFNDGVGLARTKKVSLMAYTETFDSLFSKFLDYTLTPSEPHVTRKALPKLPLPSTRTFLYVSNCFFGGATGV